VEGPGRGPPAVRGSSSPGRATGNPASRRPPGRRGPPRPARAAPAGAATRPAPPRRGRPRGAGTRPSGASRPRASAASTPRPGRAAGARFFGGGGRRQGRARGGERARLALSWSRRPRAGTPRRGSARAGRPKARPRAFCLAPPPPRAPRPPARLGPRDGDVEAARVVAKPYAAPGVAPGVGGRGREGLGFQVRTFMRARAPVCARVGGSARACAWAAPVGSSRLRPSAAWPDPVTTLPRHPAPCGFGV
jgi:hypothetical protein